jgi:hypothetical protein
VFDAWKAKAEDFVNELSRKSNQDIRDYASGWILDGAFSRDPSFRRENLEDRDYDGLPSYAEALNGVSDELGDSDEDGWSDYAEYFHGSDPSSASDHPKGIAADGQFGDWAELFPSAVNVQSTKITNSRCPKSTDIKAYAALKNQKNLIVSVISEQAPQVGDRHGWELEVKGRSIHRIIKQGSSLHRLDVVDPVSKNVVRQFLNAIPSFSKAAEWRLSGQTLQMTDAAFAAEEFRLKLSSVSYAADGVICDTTQWFLPVISDFDG